MDRSRLLVIDDDVKFTRLLCAYLNRFDYVTEVVYDGRQGLETARSGQFDAIILDVMLPGMTGWDLLKQLRRESHTPVLMLTALGDEPDRIVGLESGADDYLPKTYSMRELLARLRAVLRRAQESARVRAAAPVAPIEIGSLIIDIDAHTASLAGSTLSLTGFEFKLLATLAQHYPRVRSREQLQASLSSRPLDTFDRSIDVRVAVLRRKLREQGGSHELIETVRGAGYRLQNPPNEAR